ncbi:SDR family NAD(P)-dependent oxidoreductase [Gordonia sp. HY002]|uniref:SDR family NAD(P)-dependent oxidoreductase n=1 Tax=Gordonia zhenghanii TaxID=2911516 RepID=UPI001EF0F42D|nr:SDR family NAD(P)-dependent oxidoreductase [Gordonia zhenghanii]MCF8570233.1 SDR family NAD(P)-dependent oxidoreductase [Gordonia zhenghanii]MCF8607066.1 SDR family NAD(P)-dependent oxidoreductase [Gordonia zhenghanii]
MSVLDRIATSRADRRLAQIRTGVSGKVVAVTGGARGIGFEIAEQVIAAGGRVALGDIDSDAVGKAAADLGVEGIELDVTDAASIERFLDTVEERVGPVDVLVNNAGIMPVGSFLDYDEALIRRTVEIDFVGVILGTRAAARRMAARGGGQIVNIASVAGRLAAPGLSVYNGAKSGVIEFSETVDFELASQGVRVSAVLPSFTNTALVTGLKTNSMVRSVDTDVVGREVLTTIATQRVRAMAPMSLRWVDVTPAMPIGVKRWLAGVTGTKTMFLDTDQSARAAYSRRIGQAGDTD